MNIELYLVVPGWYLHAKSDNDTDQVCFLLFNVHRAI